MSTAAAIEAEFNSEVSKAPSYSSVYGSTRNSGPARPTPSAVVSSNFVLPSTISSDNISSLSGVENFFNGLNSKQNYSSVYSSVGSGLGSKEASAQQDIKNPAVSDIPFGFANALFENQLTPDTVAQVEAKNAGNADFNSQTFSFLQPRVTTVGEANLIGSELGAGSGAMPSVAPGPSSPSGSGPNGNYVAPSDIQQPPNQQQQQPQPTQQQPQPTQQQSGGLLGGNGMSGTSLGSTASGLLAGLEAWIQAHPIATLAIAVGALLLLGGGFSKSGGRKR